MRVEATPKKELTLFGFHNNSCSSCTHFSWGKKRGRDDAIHLILSWILQQICCLGRNCFCHGSRIILHAFIEETGVLQRRSFVFLLQHLVRVNRVQNTSYRQMIFRMYRGPCLTQRRGFSKGVFVVGLLRAPPSRRGSGPISPPPPCLS